MAGDWIAWTKGLTAKLEVLRVSEIMDISANDAACFCMAVWTWADENTADGNAVGVTAAQLSAAVRIPGIAEAMEKVGWITRSSDGLSFPNWDRYNSSSAKARLQAAARVRRHRRNASVTRPP